MGNKIQGIKEYALAHYNESGWDVLIECWEDDEIEAKAEGLALPEAIRTIGAELKIYDDYRRDIAATAF
jgi:hypothetical protein|tara:strand:- start:1112 stop:1318 length:207 start_codon:yes stop_codon:yes gene_type:complete